MLKNMLYVVPAFPVGGAEKFLISVANSMVNETSQQTVVSLSSNNKLQNEFDVSIRFLPIPRKNKYDLFSLRELSKLIKQDKPDVIFCLNFYCYLFVRIAIFGLRLNTSIYISYHTTIHISRKENLLHKFYTSILTKRDHIIFISKNQENYTVKRYHIPRRFYSIILNGIDLTKWYLPDSSQSYKQIRKQYNIPEDAPVIILTAAFRTEKNHRGAISALAILRDKYKSNAYLLFVGNGYFFKEIKQYAEEQNMTEYVIFAGQQADIRPFYWASNLFTLCSTSVETFSIAALEAMACGLPCVLTDIGGANEMIQEGLNGYLTQTDNAEIALNWSKALNKNFSAVAINEFTKQHFSAERMNAEYKIILLYNTVN